MWNWHSRYLDLRVSGAPLRVCIILVSWPKEAPSDFPSIPSSAFNITVKSICKMACPSVWSLLDGFLCCRSWSTVPLCGSIALSMYTLLYNRRKVLQQCEQNLSPVLKWTVTLVLMESLLFFFCWGGSGCFSQTVPSEKTCKGKTKQCFPLMSWGKSSEGGKVARAHRH